MAFQVLGLPRSTLFLVSDEAFFAYFDGWLK